MYHDEVILMLFLICPNLQSYTTDPLGTLLYDWNKALYFSSSEEETDDCDDNDYINDDHDRLGQGLVSSLHLSGHAQLGFSAMQRVPSRTWSLACETVYRVTAPQQAGDAR